MPSHLIGALSALIASAMAGGADFSGGFATRKYNQFQVLWLSSLTGTIILTALALLLRDGLPSMRSIIFAALAGAFGALGLAMLYYALAIGRAAIASSASGVVAAAAPVIFTAFVAGLPDPLTLLGFIIAALGIWLTTKILFVEGEESYRGLLPGILSGLGFGGFFIFIAQIEPGYLYTPLAFGKLSAAAVALIFLAVKRMPFPPVKANPYALLAGFLDVLSNIFYLTATTLTRVDIAAVLACTYPAVTVLLAVIILKERVSRTQKFGVFLCIIAIALIIT
ncbi:MAG: EamA family transporter [Bacillota bacterium]|nr:EamA family transporter [Bacillota bacterium]